MFKNLIKDLDAVMERDPAARNRVEALFCYPGIHALIFYRISNFFYRNRLFFIARIVSQIGRLATGIEIHPGATIGSGLFIDHGMGVVIGETAEVGDNVTIYQGVTLGGTGKDVGKRHPTVKNNVTIGSGAKVLGPITIGDNSKIGAGAVVVRCVPSNTTAVGVPAHLEKKRNRKINIDLDHIDIPDPLLDKIELLEERIAILEENLFKYAKIS